MALSADSHPHFTTIRDFIMRMDGEIESVFTDILTVCYAEGLIGRTMFAIDGCKISSNCAKEWSGTKEELRKKAVRIEESIAKLLDRHRTDDRQEPGQREKEEKAVESLQAKVAKIRSFLDSNDRRIGQQGREVKSNITDNESAKMPSSHGIIQGYNGIATVDEKHQVIVDAQAFGDGNEAHHVQQIVDAIEERFAKVDEDLELYENLELTADTGFTSEVSAKAVLDRGIDAYFADVRFRKRDPRFANQQEYRAKSTNRHGTHRARKYFSFDDFHFNQEGILICPASNPMRERAARYVHSPKGYSGRLFFGYKKHCIPCPLRAKCIRAKNGPHRKVTITDTAPTAMQRMVERFDTDRGRHYYSRRMGTVEPVFANIRENLGLSRFGFRGRTKVDMQWKLSASSTTSGRSRSSRCDRRGVRSRLFSP